MTKSEQLIQWFQNKPKSYLLFSGGFDSSAVLGAAMRANAEVIPIWIDNGFNRAVAQDMKIQARNLGAADLKIVEVKPGENVIENPEKRCYFCKSHILSLVPSDATSILDGTKAGFG
jgi:uncharacterized protein